MSMGSTTSFSRCVTSGRHAISTLACSVRRWRSSRVVVARSGSVGRRSTFIRPAQSSSRRLRTPRRARGTSASYRAFLWKGSWSTSGYAASNHRRTRFAHRSDRQARIGLLPGPGRQPCRGLQLRRQHRRVTVHCSSWPLSPRLKASQASVAHRMRFGVRMMPLSATRSPSSSFSSVRIISRNASISASASS